MSTDGGGSAISAAASSGSRPNFEVVLPGLDARVGVDVDAGDDADQAALPAHAELGELGRVGAVDDDQPDARVDRRRAAPRATSRCRA